MLATIFIGFLVLVLVMEIVNWGSCAVPMVVFGNKSVQVAGVVIVQAFRHRFLRGERALGEKLYCGPFR